MTIQQRPIPLRAHIESWSDLSAWCDKRLESIETDLADGETVQSVGGRVLEAKRAVLLDLAWAIGPMVAAEQAERQQAAAEDHVDAAYRRATAVEWGHA